MSIRKMIGWGVLAWGLSTHMVMAVSSLNGSTGLILIPTAEALSYMQSELAVDYRLFGSTQTNSLKYNVGIAKNLEVGILGGSVPAEGFFVNAKYFLMSDTQRYPLSMAVGVQNVGSKTESTLYLVLSKRFDQNMAVHGGFVGVFTPTEVRPEMMAGIEYMLNDKVSLLADTMTQSKKLWVNVGVRIEVLPALVLRASVLDITKAGSTDTVTTLGASYSVFL